MANLTLARRDSYLEFIRGGVKPDTLTALRTAPVHIHSLFPDSLLVKAEDEISRSEERRSSGSVHRKPGRFQPYVSSNDRSTQQPDRKPTTPAWKQLETGKLDRKVVVKPQTSPKSRPRVSKSINDNYCVLNVAGLKNSVHVSGKKQDLNPSPVTNKSETVVVLFCCKCSFCHRVATKERCRSQLLLYPYRNKACERCFLCRSLEFCKFCYKCPSCCHTSTCRGKASAVLGEMGSSGFESKGPILREGYILPFRFRPNLTRSPTVISKYVNPQRQSHLLEALYQLTNKNAVEPVENQNSLGFYNRLFLVPKPNNRWRPILDLSTLNTFLNTELFKMETPETIRTSLQVGEWVTSIDFKDAYFHIPIHSQSRKYMRFHIQGQSYQFKALPFGLSTAPMEFTVVAKEVKLMALQKGIRIHQYLDDWLVRAIFHQICLQHTLTLVALCRELGWLVNKEGKVRAGPKTGLQLCRLPVRPQGGQGQAHTRALADLNRQDIVNPVRSGVPGPAVHVPYRPSNSHRETSPPGATSYEAHTVALGKQLEGTRVTGKGDTHSQVAPPSLKMVAGGKQCSSRLTITPSKTCSANLYRRIKRRVGCSLKRAHCKGNLVSSRKQVAHKSPGTKSGLSGLKRVPRPLFKQHSPGSHRHHNSGCLYQQRRGDEVCQFVSPVPDPQTWAVDALSLSWENLNPYAFPPAAILDKVVERLQDYPCNRIILIAPGWPNMPWFWDLVAMSSQIPLCLPNLPNLVSQPFNQTLHRNLSNLNLHAWLLEPQQSRSRPSLRQWQHKLRLLKEDQPDPSMRQSGPFLQSGASVIRWTSGHHL